jgi:hypothetical protein
MSPEEQLQLANELRKAGKAGELLENEIFKDSVRKIEESLLAGMRAAPIADDKLRLRLLDKYECLYAVLDELNGVIATDKLAEEQIKQDSMLERAKGFLGIN